MWGYGSAPSLGDDTRHYSVGGGAPEDPKVLCPREDD